MIRRVVVGALMTTLAALVVESGCSGDPGAHRVAMPRTPLAPVAAAPVAASPSLVAARDDEGFVDLQTFTPLLSRPELEGASDALESGDAARAVRELEAAMARRAPEPPLVPRFQLLLGRLRELAGDLPGAAASYEIVARETFPLAGYAALGAGRTLLRSGHPREALDWLSRVPAGEPSYGDSRLLVAEASMLLGDRETAIETYRAFLAAEPSGADAAQVALRLSEALVEESSQTAPAAEREARGLEALGLARRILVRAPADAAAVGRARAVEIRALALLPAAERARRLRLSPEEELERVRALVDGKQNEAARQAADALLSSIGDQGRKSALGCDAAILRARAYAGLHEWGKGGDSLGDTTRRCKDRDLRARALFLAGKYFDADKRYAQAIKAYETLEKELPEHRLADDARLRAAESYSELGSEAEFTELLTRMPDDYPNGDMVLDGLFELAGRRIAKGDWTGAASILERAAAIAAPIDARRGQEFAGRERYFRARAWGMTGEEAKSLSEYEAMVRELPLSYYMLHAYSRLASVDSARARRALEEAEALSARSAFRFERRPELELPGFVRALELLRIGDVDGAGRELDALGVLKPDSAPSVLWTIALLYDRAGAAKLSHQVARSLLTDWLERWPAGEWARAWQLAFPRPFRDLVAREAKRNGVPEPLVYAVMREESSFDPSAESPAKAYGLMQLIEPTAKTFGKTLGLRPNADSLKRPEVNVAIGCRVLSELTREFPENPLLAIPGYNAGPGRPRHWLDEWSDVDFDVWVELIPFNETRRYTKRVLASRAAYAFLYAPDRAEEAMRLPMKLSTAARLAKK
jgi:soluble lytic murein transglycosylase